MVVFPGAPAEPIPKLDNWILIMNDIRAITTYPELGNGFSSIICFFSGVFHDLQRCIGTCLHRTFYNPRVYNDALPSDLIHNVRGDVGLGSTQP
ncbi:hypothetical protein Tco_0869835 [Tanacetum coccineum]